MYKFQSCWPEAYILVAIDLTNICGKFFRNLTPNSIKSQYKNLRINANFSKTVPSWVDIMKVAFVGAGVGGGGGGGRNRNRKLNNQHAFFMDLACYKLCKSLAYHSRESCNGCILFFLYSYNKYRTLHQTTWCNLLVQTEILFLVTHL